MANLVSGLSGLDSTLAKHPSHRVVDTVGWLGLGLSMETQADKPPATPAGNPPAKGRKVLLAAGTERSMSRRQLSVSGLPSCQVCGARIPGTGARPWGSAAGGAPASASAARGARDRPDREREGAANRVDHHRSRSRMFGRHGPSFTIDVLTSAADEIVRLRKRLEVSEQRLEGVGAGAPAAGADRPRSATRADSMIGAHRSIRDPVWGLERIFRCRYDRPR